MEGVDGNIYGEHLNYLLFFITPHISADPHSADAILFLVTPGKWDRTGHTPFRGFISGVGFMSSQTSDKGLVGTGGKQADPDPGLWGE